MAFQFHYESQEISYVNLCILELALLTFLFAANKGRGSPTSQIQDASSAIPGSTVHSTSDEGHDCNCPCQCCHKGACVPIQVSLPPAPKPLHLMPPPPPKVAAAMAWRPPTEPSGRSPVNIILEQKAALKKTQPQTPSNVSSPNKTFLDTIKNVNLKKTLNPSNATSKVTRQVLKKLTPTEKKTPPAVSGHVSPRGTGTRNSHDRPDLDENRRVTMRQSQYTHNPSPYLDELRDRIAGITVDERYISTGHPNATHSNGPETPNPHANVLRATPRIAGKSPAQDATSQGIIPWNQEWEALRTSPDPHGAPRKVYSIRKTNQQSPQTDDSRNNQGQK